MHEFELEDSDGQIHTYKVQQPHPPISRGNGIGGIQLINRVTRAAGAPLSRLINSNIGEIATFVIEQQDRGEEATIGDIIEEYEIEDLDDLDLELPKAFDAFCDALEHVDSERTIKAIFQWTLRDGLDLSDDGQFNQAYQQNYLEMVRAAWEIVRFNGFFGSFGTNDGDEGDEE